MAGWASLSPDLLGSIAELLILVDLIRFTAVCRSWASAVMAGQCHPSPSLTPWLMIPGYQGDTASFLDLSTFQTYRISIPDIGNPSWVRSSSGWVVALANNSAIQLVNPLTGTRVKLDPPYPYNSPGTHKQVYYLQKMVLCPTPTDGQNLAALAFPDMLLITRAGGDKGWALLDHGSYKDIAYHNGILYALSSHHQVIIYAWDLTKPSPECALISEELPQNHQRHRMFFRQSCTEREFKYVLEHLEDASLHHDNYYLVGSPTPLGLLLLRITKWSVRDETRRRRRTEYWWTEVQVLSLDATGGSWSYVDSLGDCSLFLGRINSLAVSTLDNPDVTRNRIYIHCSIPDPHGPTKLYLEMFDLENGSRTSLYLTECKDDRPSLIWFTPNLPWGRYLDFLKTTVRLG